MKYPDRFNGNYSAFTVYNKALTLNRTLMSSYSVNYGIFDSRGPALNSSKQNTIYAKPPFDDPDRIKKIVDGLDKNASIVNNFQPVSIHTEFVKDDVELATYSSFCPNSQSWILENQKDSESDKIFNLLKETTKDLEDKGIKLNNLTDYTNLGDLFMANYYDHKDLPKDIDVNSTIFRDVKFAYEWFLTHSYTGKEVQSQVYN